MTSNDRTERTKTMRNPCLTPALDELVKVGIRHLEIANGGKHLQSLTPALDELVKVGILHLEIANGGKHLQIRWNTASGQRHTYTLSRSPSDWRAAENARHGVRRILRAPHPAHRRHARNAGATAAAAHGRCCHGSRAGLSSWSGAWP